MRTSLSVLGAVLAVNTLSLASQLEEENSRAGSKHTQSLLTASLYFYPLQRPSLCSPSSSSPTSSVQVPVPPRPTGRVTPAPSVLQRVAVPMVTVLQGSVYVASSTPQHVAPPSPPTPPTSGTRDTPAATLPPVLPPAPTLSRKCRMTSVSWGWTSRHSPDLPPLQLPGFVMTLSQWLDRRVWTLHLSVGPTQAITVSWINASPRFFWYLMAICF